MIEAACPQCSPEEEIMHSVVKSHLLKCEQCGFIHRLPHEKKNKPITLKVIVSRGSESSSRQLEVDPDEMLRKDDEFVIDVGEDVSGVRIHSLELPSGRRVEHAMAKDVLTVWARAIDEVVVKIAVQQLGETKSFDYKINGDYEFTIGDKMKLKSYEVFISSIKVREGGIFRRAGKAIKAKDIRRIYSKIVSQERRTVGEGLRASKKRSGGDRERS